MTRPPSTAFSPWQVTTILELLSLGVVSVRMLPVTFRVGYGGPRT